MPHNANEPDNDRDLRAIFARLRQADRAVTPLFNVGAPTRRSPVTPTPAPWLKWGLPLAAACAAVVTVGLWRHVSRHNTSRLDLVHALPPLMPRAAWNDHSADGPPMATLTTIESGSDFLIPTDLSRDSL